jgi:type IV pilus assembly protein PilC
MLAAAQLAESKPIRKRLDRLQIALMDGGSFSEAMKLSVPEASQRTIEVISSAERNGALPHALDRLVREQTNKATNQIVANQAFQTAYIIIIPLFMAAVVTAVMIFVMPKYQQIFKDFGIRLPYITTRVLDLTSNLAGPVAIVMLIALLYVCGSSWSQLFTSRAPRQSLRWMTDRIVWYTPVLHAIARDRGLTDACTTMADALDNGRTLIMAVFEAAQPHLNAILRNRIELWGRFISAGQDTASAAREAGLPSLISGMIVAGSRSDHLPATMRFLARYYQTRFSRTATVLRNATLPILAIVMGVLVATIALALFLPIISLIDAVLLRITSKPW